MRKLSLVALGREQLARAKQNSAGRGATSVFGGHEHSLRQTLVALAAGRSMGEHNAPSEATLHVLAGRVRLRAAEESWEGRSGDLIIIPPTRHDVEALEDAVVLLTVAMRPGSTGQPEPAP